MVQFGRYELLERISFGGMAEIYKARVAGAAGFQKIVAVKRILPELAEDPELEEAFINEATLAANLNHPNIGQMYDFGEIDGQYFIAMEYVHGRDLRSIQQYFRAKSQVMPLQMALHIALQVCAALDYAHHQADAGGQQHGIVHRDVSPPNILISLDGAVKLIDFGIAKALNRTRKTATGFLKGKLSYLSPEQAEGRDVDSRSDLFSLGIVLFEMATGVRLFDEDTDMATLTKVRRAEVPPPSQVNAALPRTIDLVILKALARSPSQRYQRADSFYEALESYAYQERLTLSALQLSRWMFNTFGANGILSTQVSPAPSAVGRLEPEPALGSASSSGWDQETGSLPALHENGGAPASTAAVAGWDNLQTIPQSKPHGLPEWTPTPDLERSDYPITPDLDLDTTDRDLPVLSNVVETPVIAQPPAALQQVVDEPSSEPKLDLLGLMGETGQRPSIADGADRAVADSDHQAAALPRIDQLDHTIPMPTAPDLPQAARPRRRWWLLWLALIMFILGLAGTLAGIFVRF